MLTEKRVREIIREEAAEKSEQQPTLKFAWGVRLRFRAEGNKLWAEGHKIRAKGNKLWAEAILEIYGNILLEWKNWNAKYQSYECHLENGEVYGFDC